jgi:uncharacterized protein YggE
MLPQLINHPWGVAVQGSARVTAPPDLVRIRFRITRLEQAPTLAFEAATTVLSHVRAVLRDHGVAKTQESRLGLRTVWNYGEPTQTLVGYECTAALLVESTSLDDVPRLLADLVAAGAHEIDSVEFDVADRSSMQAEAGRQAVAAARATASGYASAAGMRLGTVLHIEDADAQPIAMALVSRATPGSADDLAPGEVVVVASVRVGFAMTRD